MLFKNKGDKCDPKFYRPISVTSVLLRLLEKVLTVRFWKHMDKNKIIIQQQTGFRKCRQTRDNLLFLSQKTSEAYNQGKKVVAVFYDVDGAFDSVWHAGLIKKLVDLNFPDYLIAFTIDYLDSRYFVIKIGNTFSAVYKIDCSVPQGGCLSPMLFILYVNDLEILQFNNLAYTSLFADDVKDMFIFNNIDDRSCAIINKRLKQFEYWLNRWRLKINPDKCNYLIFSKNKKTGSNEELSIKMYGKKIPMAKDGIQKFLGINFDKYLTFNYHIGEIEEKCNSRLNILRILKNKRWRINNKTLLNIYYTLIRSIIDYFLLLYPVLNDMNKNKLQIIQNKALRIIGNYRQDEISIEELHEELEVEYISTRAINLKERYLKINTKSGNPMLHHLLLDFRNFAEKNTIKFQTPLSEIDIQTNGYLEITAEEMAQQALGIENLFETDY